MEKKDNVKSDESRLPKGEGGPQGRVRGAKIRLLTPHPPPIWRRASPSPFGRRDWSDFTISRNPLIAAAVGGAGSEDHLNVSFGFGESDIGNEEFHIRVGQFVPPAPNVYRASVVSG